MESSDRLKGSHRLTAATTESSVGRITRAAGFTKDFDGFWSFPVEARAADRYATSSAKFHSGGIGVAASAALHVRWSRFNVRTTKRFDCLGWCTGDRFKRRVPAATAKLHTLSET